MSLEPGFRVGAYEIVGPLGAGGMGSVYRARDTRLGRQVAIKLVSDELAANRTALARLGREARLTSSLNHPNIVTVHDVGELDGKPYIVMELVEGQSLHDRIAAGDLPIAEAVRLAAQVADGLSAAHAAGAIHRDLKPRNIMLTSGGHAKIVDFGLGKSAPVLLGAEEPTNERDITDTHNIVGTAGYMAPEQVSRQGIDFRADQFALGAIVYEMVSGRRAFRRETALQTMVSIVESEPTPLSEVAPEAPVELQTIVARCLSKDRSRRYASTQDLARDLHDVHSLLNSGSRPRSSSRPADPQPPRPTVNRWLIAAVLAVIAIGSAWAVLYRPDRELTQARVMLDRYDRVENIDRAIEALSGLVASEPDDPAAHALLGEAFVRKYDQAQDKSFLDKASQSARAALALNERHAHTHVVLAMISIALGGLDGAIAEANRAIALDPENGIAWRELGRTYQRQGKNSDAEQAYRRATELRPADWSVHNQLGGLLYNASRVEEALASFQRATEAAPDNVRALNNLGSTYRGSGKLTEATAAYERSLSIAPNATAAQNLGTMYYEQGQYADAAKAYEKGVALPNATAAHWRNLAAAAYWVPGLRPRAKVAYEKVVELGEKARAVNAKEPTTLTNLANAYAALSLYADDPRAAGWRDLGRTTADAASRLHLQNQEQLSILAGAYEQLGDRDNALRFLRDAVKAGLDPAKILASPWLKDLQSDPRLKEVMSTGKSKEQEK